MTKEDIKLASKVLGKKRVKDFSLEKVKYSKKFARSMNRDIVLMNSLADNLFDGDF